MTSSPLAKKTPRETYQNALKSEGFISDDAQAKTVELLQSVYEALVVEAKPVGWLRGLLSGKAR